jgi:hypothetical protein
LFISLTLSTLSHTKSKDKAREEEGEGIVGYHQQQGSIELW